MPMPIMSANGRPSPGWAVRSESPRRHRAGAAQFGFGLALKPGGVAQSAFQAFPEFVREGAHRRIGREPTRVRIPIRIVARVVNRR